MAARSRRTTTRKRAKPSTVYFLGVGGTLMGSLALLASEAGYKVAGSDKRLYPPMSDQLAASPVTVYEGFAPEQLDPVPDQIIIGNAGLPRGHPAIEYILDRGLPYQSGAEWLGRALLKDRWVVAAAGTHGKTTTASIVAWILESAGMAPGFLIGGVPNNFGLSSRLGKSPLFALEADEYDTSYFDRRSKFVHYRPRTLIINNLEYDHADIFDDLGAIQTQFHNLLRTVPGNGLVIAPSADEHVEEVLSRGCWTPISRIGTEPPRRPHMRDTGEWWHAESVNSDGSHFEVWLNERHLGTVDWVMLGAHNVHNALAAVAATRHAGVLPDAALAAIGSFEGVKRRLETVATVGGVTVYDDFAHHPTAIRTTLQALRSRVGNEEIIAVIEPRTHTMSLGTLRQELTTCCAYADHAIWFRGENIRWDLSEVVNECVVPARQFDDLDKLIDALVVLPAGRRHIVIMSNGDFGGIYRKLPERLAARQPAVDKAL